MNEKDEKFQLCENKEEGCFGVGRGWWWCDWESIQVVITIRKHSATPTLKEMMMTGGCINKFESYDYVAR